MSLDIETRLAELEALVGDELVRALQSATARVDNGRPYSLTEALDEARIEIAELRNAFSEIAKSRNEWRARAKRTGVGR